MLWNELVIGKDWLPWLIMFVVVKFLTCCSLDLSGRSVLLLSSASIYCCLYLACFYSCKCMILGSWKILNTVVIIQVMSPSFLNKNQGFTGIIPSLKTLESAWILNRQNQDLESPWFCQNFGKYTWISNFFFRNSNF